MSDKLYRITFDNYLNKSLSQRKASSYKNNLNTTASDKLWQHLQNAPAKYSGFIEFIIPYLYPPNIFFALQDNLIMTQAGTIIFSNAVDFFGYMKKNYNEFPNVLDFYIDFTDPYFQKLYKLCYSYLKCYKDIPSPYNRYMAYIYKSLKHNNDLYPIFMNPHTYFHMLNKELSYKQPSDKRIVLGQDIISMLSSYGISANKLIPLLRIIPKLLDNSAFHTSAPCCSSNYSFNFSHKRNIFHAYFIDDEIKYEKCQNEYMCAPIISTVDPEHFTAISPMQSWIDILYAITGGIKKNMDNFSMICALIMTNYYKNINYTLPSKNCSPLSLYIIYAPEKQAALLRYYLQCLIPSAYEESDYQLKDITKTKNLLNLVKQNYIYPSYIPVKPSESKESESQIETIKKIMQRKEIHIKDSYGINHTIINHLPIICFVNNPKQLSYLQANFKTKIFSFMPHDASINAEYSTKDCQLLINFLSIYGLKMLFDINHQQNRPNEPIATESVTQCFIKDCLKPEPNHACYADYLYEVYSNYYQLFYIGSPLSKICFTKELRKTLPYEYEYKKPRHSRSDNRYAFIGINIDINKAQKAAEHAANIRKNISEKSVSDYLINVRNSVNEILQTLHNNLPK